MADNFNVSLNGPSAAEEAAAGLDSNNPAMTYVDFANQLVKNSQAQQAQEEAIKQAQLMTQQKTAAANMGVNPELKNFLPIDEAVGELKAAGVDDDTIQKFVDSLNGQQIVNRAAIDTIIRKKQLSIKTAGAGKDYKTTEDIVIPAGMKAEDMGLVSDPTRPGIGHVPADGVYTPSIDPNSGQPVYFTPGGSTPDNSAKATQHQSDEDRKDLKSLSQDIAKIVNPSRGNWVSQNVGRAGRALSELNQHPNLTAQTLGFINQELGGIFIGGVPPQSELEKTSIQNVIQSINARLNQITGNPQIFNNPQLLKQQKEYLVDLLTTLHNSTKDLAKQMMLAKVAGYPDLQKDRPGDVQNLLDENLNILDAGMSAGAKSDLAAETTKQNSGATTPTASTPGANKPSLQDIFGAPSNGNS